jgi:hypothetical protein
MVAEGHSDEAPSSPPRTPRVRRVLRRACREVSGVPRVEERPDGPDGLVVRKAARPEPRPGWALVRVEAFGLNRSEYKTLKGYAGDAVTFPRILGIELVRVVEAVHGDAPRGRRGRRPRH